MIDEWSIDDGWMNDWWWVDWLLTVDEWIIDVGWTDYWWWVDWLLMMAEWMDGLCIDGWFVNGSMNEWLMTDGSSFCWMDDDVGMDGSWLCMVRIMSKGCRMIDDRWCEKI